MKFKLILTFSLFILLAGLSSQAFGTDKADGICLEQTDEYTLQDDGSIIHRVEKQLKVLTLYSFHRAFGETFIVHDPRYEELKINLAVTTMADGKVVECTENAKNLILPGACENSAAYLHLREMVVTHFGLEIGSVIHVDYEVKTKAGYVPYLMGREIFGSTMHPIEKKIVVVNVPESVELKFQLLNCDKAETDVFSGNGFKKYVWNFSNLPQIPPEASAQDLADYVPCLVFSTCPTWKDAAASLNQRITDASWLDEVSEAKVNHIKGKASNHMELARMINRFVVEEVANVNLDPQSLGYNIQQAKDVFKNNAGCSLDKGVLLVKMLRTAGFQAEPVFVSRSRAVANDVPSWLQFKECRVICTLQTGLDRPLFLENLLYFSPTKLISSAFQEDLAGFTIFRPSLSTKENILKKISSLKIKDNLVKADLNLALDDKLRLTGDMAIEVGGVLNPHLALSDDYELWAKARLASLVPGGEFKDVKPMFIGCKRSAFKGGLKSPKGLKDEHGFYEYNIPIGPGKGVSSLHIPIAGEKRTTPIQLGHPVLEEINITIKIPDSVEVASLPSALQEHNKAGMIIRGASVENGLLQIKRVIMVNQLISPDDFSALKLLVTEYMAPDTRRVLFRLKN